MIRGNIIIDFGQERDALSELGSVGALEEGEYNSYLALIRGAGARTDVVWGYSGVMSPLWDCNDFAL